MYRCGLAVPRAAVTPAALASLRSPLTGHGFSPTSPAEVRVLPPEEVDAASASKASASDASASEPGEPNAVLELTIVEGRNRQVRRLCKRAGLPLKTLTRVAVGPIALGGLAEGGARALSASELDACVALCMPPGTRRARLPLPLDELRG